MFIIKLYEKFRLRGANSKKATISGLLLLVILLTGCQLNEKILPQPTTLSAKPTQTIEKKEELEEVLNLTPLPLPSFITSILPEPGSKMTLPAFENTQPFPDSFGVFSSQSRKASQICFVMLFGPNPVPREPNKVDFYINDILIEGGIIEVLISGRIDSVRSPTLWCFDTELEQGIHNMSLQFTQTTGNILEYQWQLKLVEKAHSSTLLPLPSFITGILPEPGSKMTLRAFESDQPFPDSFWIGATQVRQASRFCFSMNFESFVLPGDTHTDLKTKTDIDVYVDGILTKNGIGEELLGGTTRIFPDGRRGQIRPPNVWCYYAKLESGIHNISLQYTHTTGNIIEYQWQLELVK